MENLLDYPPEIRTSLTRRKTNLCLRATAIAQGREEVGKLFADVQARDARRVGCDAVITIQILDCDKRNITVSKGGLLVVLQALSAKLGEDWSTVEADLRLTDEEVVRAAKDEQYKR